MLDIALLLQETLINGEFGGFYLIDIWAETRKLHENNYLKVNIYFFSFYFLLLLQCKGPVTNAVWHMLSNT